MTGTTFRRFSHALLALVWTCLMATNAPSQFRPPAVPLVTHDPYFSVWSFDDHLYDGWSRHWTGATNALCGLVRIDGKPYRFAGSATVAEPIVQTKLDVTATRSIYEFEGAGVRLKAEFMSPLLPEDLDLLSRPVTYLTLSAKSLDGRPHEVSVYVDVTAEWCVDKQDQEVVWSRAKVPGQEAMRIGTKAQAVLAKRGDDVRIDWGHLYVSAPKGAMTSAASADNRACFADSGKLLPDAKDMPRAANDRWPVLAAATDLGKVVDRPKSTTYLIAYDDEFSIELMRQRLRPWWRRNGEGMEALLAKASKEQSAIHRRCEQFDREVDADLRRVGGDQYAALATISYRQCVAAHKLVSGPSGDPLFFSKENFSNGCIATVDVTYPSAPLMLLFNTKLLRGMLSPVLDYAASDVWKHPFAPHDLGTYPLANGQVYGGGASSAEDQMPVEESGNLLILVGALAQAEGTSDFANRYWPTLTKWAEYLRHQGFDPENQLCTDDFAGHMAHNANLSIKAILGIGAFAKLCTTTGHEEQGKVMRKAAEEMVSRWVQAADDGDHYRLAFDKPGSWSQKYNLVWDRLLNLGLFPTEIAEKEMAFYKKSLGKYGLPLDNRRTYTKADWTIWSATLTGKRSDFDALVEPVYRFAQETPDRMPLTDWYETTDARCVGFRARSVVGGLFLPMLGDSKLWKKWSSRAQP